MFWCLNRSVLRLDRVLSSGRSPLKWQTSPHLFWSNSKTTNGAAFSFFPRVFALNSDRTFFAWSQVESSRVESFSGLPRFTAFSVKVPQIRIYVPLVTELLVPRRSSSTQWRIILIAWSYKGLSALWCLFSRLMEVSHCVGRAAMMWGGQIYLLCNWSTAAFTHICSEQIQVKSWVFV